MLVSSFKNATLKHAAIPEGLDTDFKPLNAFSHVDVVVALNCPSSNVYLAPGRGIIVDFRCDVAVEGCGELTCHPGEAVSVFGLRSRRSIWSLGMLYATECGIRVKAQSQINIIATARIVEGINKQGRRTTFKNG